MFVLVCASLWIKVGWDLVCGAAAVITKAISVRSRKYIVIQQNTQMLQSWFFKGEGAITSSKSEVLLINRGGANRAKTYLTEAFPTYTFLDPNFFRAKNVLECRGKNIVISGCFDFEDLPINVKSFNKQKRIKDNRETWVRWKL